MRLLRWLYPGIGFKRWLLAFAAGTFLLGLGLAIMLDASVVWWAEANIAELFSPGKPLATSGTGFGIAALGLVAALFAVQGIVRSIYQATVPKGGESLGKLLLNRRHLEKGPKIVVVGGGTGLSTLLRGLKEYTDNLTALVTVADDGGSSGRLRHDLGILPPGDIRNCLLAMADTEPLMQKLFQYRFKEGSGLAGHNFGNLFIAALTEVTGDFEEAVRQSSKVLAVRGKVLPATLDNVTLCAVLEDGGRVCGESNISRAPCRIREIYLEPADARPTAEAVMAIEEADAIILGPGSLFTSVISNLVVPGISDAILRSSALKILVCNVMTQPNETTGFSAADHVRAVFKHGGSGLVETVVVNARPIPPEYIEKYREQSAEPVLINRREIESLGINLVEEDLVSLDSVVRHSPQALAQCLMRIIVQVKGTAIRNRLLEIYLQYEKMKG